MEDCDGETTEYNADGSSKSFSAQREPFRSQQSLGLITQKFMSLRQQNVVMNLNDVAKELGISKRRVYDVVNVLEGLGYVEKVEKNNIRWIEKEEHVVRIHELEASVEQLRQQEMILDNMVGDTSAMLRLHFEDPVLRSYNYVSKADIRATSAINKKSIMVKSDIDTESAFDVRITDSMLESDGPFQMIVRQKNGVRSHALLFTHDQPAAELYGQEEEVEEEKEDEEEEVEEKKVDMTLASFSHESGFEHQQEDPDIDDLETFVIPSSNGNTSTSNSQQYIPETPGRGLLMSPFKTLIDPTCILPSFSEDHGYIHLTTPIGQNEMIIPGNEPASILDLFAD